MVSSFIEEEIETWIWCWRQSGRPISTKGMCRLPYWPSQHSAFHTPPPLNSHCLSKYCLFHFQNIPLVPPLLSTSSNSLYSTWSPHFLFCLLHKTMFSFNKSQRHLKQIHISNVSPFILTFRGSLKVTVNILDSYCGLQSPARSLHHHLHRCTPAMLTFLHFLDYILSFFPLLVVPSA